jgi:uncharacterized protein HemY
MKKGFLITGFALTVFAVGLWIWARPAYRTYREHQAVRQAERFLAAGHFPEASLSARQALQINPQNLEACQIMAELAEKSGSPLLLDWRRRIVELAPSTQSKLLLASAALHFQTPPYPLAAQTLAALASTANDQPAYHALAAELALRLRQPADAEAHFQQAARLEPGNELHQLNLSVLRLDSTNASVAAEGRATLERLRSSTNAGGPALHWLIADALRRERLDRAEAFSQELLKRPHPKLEDRLQHLRILHMANKRDFATGLSSLQEDCRTNAADVYAICSWMVHEGLVREAAAWLADCPANVQDEQPVPLAFVECYVAGKDWGGLENYLQAAKWGDVEFLRLAYLSRAAREQQQSLAADARWRSAVQQAADRLGPLVMLLGLANSWKNGDAQEDLLWRIARRFPEERWALGELDRVYKSTGNTRGLNKLYEVIVSYDSRNVAAQNNWAATSLLLNLNVSRAHDLARDIYQQHPDDPIIASTFGYSLFRQGRTNEALATFERLKPEDLEHPAVALYFGVVLAANGQTGKAVEWIARARLHAASFLPEEQVLLAQALPQNQ